MKVISVNLATPVEFEWNGKTVTTGIYKKPVHDPIWLETESVKDDAVIDRRYHGGVDKACYLYSLDYYDHWKKQYPELNWEYGMFGENVTVSGLDEANIHVGSKYQLGEALVQITQPRQPCYKLGVKFGTQKVLKDFISFGHPGTYVRILQPGKVSKQDTFTLVEESHEKSIKEVFDMLY